MMKTLREDFLEKVAAVKFTMLEAGFRHVKADVLYHMPDHPGILQQFIHDEPHDYFAIAGELMGRIDTLLSKQGKLLTPQAAEQIEALFVEVEQGLKDHLRALSRTPDFAIDFAPLTQDARMAAIEAVPFAKLRHFLSHWHNHLDGPMNMVRVVASPLPEEQLTALFNRASERLKAVAPVALRTPSFRL